VAEWTPPPAARVVSLLRADEPPPAVLDRLAARLAPRLERGRAGRVVSLTLHLSGGRRLFAAEPARERVDEPAGLVRAAGRLLERLEARIPAAVLEELEQGLNGGWTRGDGILPPGRRADPAALAVRDRALPPPAGLPEIGPEAIELAVSELESSVSLPMPRSAVGRAHPHYPNPVPGLGGPGH
jgi:hypothetical protein